MKFFPLVNSEDHTQFFVCTKESFSEEKANELAVLFEKFTIKEKFIIKK